MRYGRYRDEVEGRYKKHSEAIRPSGMSARTAGRGGLSGIEAKLYELIWKRTVATQMAKAKIALTTAMISVTDPETGLAATFRASGREVMFPGFFHCLC